MERGFDVARKRAFVWSTAYEGAFRDTVSIGGLPSGNLVFFRVAANNTEGRSEWSDNLITSLPLGEQAPVIMPTPSPTPVTSTEETDDFIPDPESATFYYVIILAAIVLILVILIIVIVVRQKQGKNSGVDRLVRNSLARVSVAAKRVSAAVRPGREASPATAYHAGQKVTACFTEDQQWYPAVIVQYDEPSAHWLVQYPEYGNEEWLPPSAIRA